MKCLLGRCFLFLQSSSSFKAEVTANEMTLNSGVATSLRVEARSYTGKQSVAPCTVRVVATGS